MIRCMGCMKEYEDGLTVCPHCGYAQGTPAREAYQLPPETILNGRYLVGRVLGFGGFGTTYIAWDLVLEKKVAIKEYMPSDFATRAPGETQLSVYDGELGEQFEAGLKSFIDESRRLAKFNHEDGIVHIFDSFLENGTAYIVMEYLEGKTLKEILKERGGKIPYEEAVGYILPVLKSLDAVHQTGIIHRDIAPDNIFLTNDGKVKLIDFGASRYATTLHSKSLSVILKQGYAPEEQYRSHGEQGPWSDVYAVCATLYRAITGIVPEDALERCASDKLVPPSKMGINLPVGIENAILNGLNTKAENRIQSAKELAQALSGEIEVQRIKEEKKKEDVGKWSKKQIIIASCSGVAVLAVIILAVLGVFNLNKSLDTTLYATVPDYIGMTLDEAQADWDEYCTEQGITNISLSVLDGVTADTITGYEVNQIYAVAPEVGSWFKKAETEQKYLYVTVVLKSVQQMIEENQGKDSWVMQDLENYSQADAQRILESMVGVNFTFEMIASEKSAGTVVRTEPDTGTQINKGDMIIVYVSDGSKVNVVETVDSSDLPKKDIQNQNEEKHSSLGNNSPSPSQKYTLQVVKEAGISGVTGAGTYAAGQNVTVTAAVSSGYTFSGWKSSSPEVVPNSGSITYTFTMPSRNVTLTANALKIGAIIASGKCGNNISWILDEKGLLNITGTGPMYDYQYYGTDSSEKNPAPWCDYALDDKVQKVIISDGITHIGDESFYYLQNIFEISIPNSVTSIGDRIFRDCDALTEIHIPTGVKSIGNYAFYQCANLKSIDFPNTLLTIGDGAFDSCTSLSTIDLPDSVTSIGGAAFSRCPITSFQFPSKLTAISSGMFSQTDLTSITIPPTIQSIGSGAFSYCNNLTRIVIPDGVPSIESQTFYGCDNLAYVSIPDGAQYIGEYAFSYCYNLKKIVIPGSVESIKMDAFKGCSKLSEVNLQNGVKSLGSAVFDGCDSLQSITIPKSLIYIDESWSPFKFIPGLKNIYVDPQNPEFSSIDGVLFNKNATKLIMFPSGRTGTYTIPSTVNTIGSEAFRKSRLPNDIINIIIPYNVTYVQEYAFALNDSCTIYVQGKTSAPTGWDSKWNDGANVVWNA